MMKTIVFIVALLFSLQVANAQQNSFGPHGGRLKTIGKYKIELFGCNDHIEVYLFDSDTNAINNADIVGNVEFYYDGSATLTSLLAHYGMDGFTAKIPSNMFTYCKPVLDIDEKFIITEKFENECLISAEKK
jgi:hypothetical protein